jgi:hypothetical protein
MSNYKQGAIASLIISIIIFIIVFILIIVVSYNWRVNYYNNSSNQLTSQQLLAAAAMYNKNHFITQGGVMSPLSIESSAIASTQSNVLNSANIVPQQISSLINKSTFQGGSVSAQMTATGQELNSALSNIGGGAPKASPLLRG